MQDTQDNISLYKKVKYKFDLITSNHGTNWLLALNWILVLEFLSTIIEYQFVDVAKNFVIHIPNSLQKELAIAVMIVLFIWYSIYNFIFMQKNKFLTFTLYVSVCIYLLFTHDLSFNLLIHNLNIFEVTLGGFGFYMIFQLLLKFIIFYLLYKMLVAIKNRNNII